MIVLTGAGISAESGVPTFRGAGGLWRNYRPEELATPEAFARNPGLVWEWYRWRRGIVRGCAPNVAHHSIARHALRRGGVTLATQNVDGLHSRAAVENAESLVVAPDAALPLELHGSILRSRCTRCDARVESAEDREQCGSCGGLLRPDVVWFGEPLEPAVLGAAEEAAANADLALVVGTSAVVHPAAGLALLARRVVEVNPEETPITRRSTVSLRGTACGTVPVLLDQASRPSSSF
jgi:NAD-dependent deacetylase